MITRSADKAAAVFADHAEAGKAVVAAVPDYAYNSNGSGDENAEQPLVAALRGHDALVVLLNRGVLAPHLALIDAAAAAGVRRVVPSCFSVDGTDARVRAAPCFREKIAMEDHVRTAAAAGRLTFTGLQTALFLDWAVRNRVVLNAAGPGPTAVVDGGDIRQSGSHLGDIGRAVVRILEYDAEDEKVKNRFLHMHSYVFTQNELLRYAREAAPDREFPTVAVSSVEAEKKSREALDQGSKDPSVMRGFLTKVLFADGKGLFERVDNDVLGIEQWSQEKMKAMISDAVAGKL